MYAWKFKRPTITFMKEPNKQWVCITNQDPKFNPHNGQILDFLTECLIHDPFKMTRDVEIQDVGSEDVSTTVLVDFDPYAYNIHQSDAFHLLQEGIDFTAPNELISGFYDQNATTFKATDGNLYLIVKGDLLMQSLINSPLYTYRYSRMKTLKAHIMTCHNHTFAQYVSLARRDEKNIEVVFIPVYTPLGYMYATHIQTLSKHSFDLIYFQKQPDGEFTFKTDIPMPEFTHQWQHDMFFKFKIIEVLNQCIVDRVCHRLFRWKPEENSIQVSLFFLSFHYFDKTFIDEHTVLNLKGVVARFIRNYQCFVIENQGIYFKTTRFLLRALMDEFYIFNEVPVCSYFTADQLNVKDVAYFIVFYQREEGKMLLRGGLRKVVRLSSTTTGTLDPRSGSRL